jgi:DNA-binding NarL/FixJ family response regulator
VLAFSAHDDERTMQEMYAAGADGYIVKGSKVTAIIASIRDAAAGSRMRRAA